MLIKINHVFELSSEKCKLIYYEDEQFCMYVCKEISETVDLIKTKSTTNGKLHNLRVLSAILYSPYLHNLRKPVQMFEEYQPLSSRDFFFISNFLFRFFFLFLFLTHVRQIRQASKSIQELAILDKYRSLGSGEEMWRRQHLSVWQSFFAIGRAFSEF